MPVRDRSYRSGCIAAHALDLIGDRWALLIVRELMLGPQRFGGIRANLPGIATNVLTTRLEEMETAGVVHRVALTPSDATGWGLTPAGRSLWPVLQALCQWGTAMPGHDTKLPMSPSSLMLSMKAQILPGPARSGGDREAAFILNGEGFIVSIRDGQHHVARTDNPASEIAFEGHPNSVACVVYGPRPAADAAADAGVTVSGDPARVQQFVELFTLNPIGDLP